MRSALNPWLARGRQSVSAATASATPVATAAPAAAAAGTGVAQPLCRAIEGRIREITPAVHGRVRIAPVHAAIRLVNEAAGNAQLGVEREQQRQPSRCAGIDVLFLAGEPPYPPQTDVVLLIDALATQYHRRRVMQKPPNARRQNAS